MRIVGGLGRVVATRSRIASASRYLCAAVLPCIAATAAAQDRGRIVGMVRDTAGAAVAEADVGILSLRLLTRTDTLGHFLVKDVRPLAAGSHPGAGEDRPPARPLRCELVATAAPNQMSERAT